MLRLGARVAATAGVAGVAVQMTRMLSMQRSEHQSTSDALKQFLCFDALRVIAQRARAAHDADCEAFARVQASVLRSQLEANCDTAFGREHNFSSILASTDIVEAFRQQMSITTGNDYEPWVQRIASGESNVLNAEAETQLAATSGTSGKRTRLPNTPTMSSTIFARGILVVFDTLRLVLPSAFQLQHTCKLAFAPSFTTTECGLKVGPNSSNPNAPSFRRLLFLYSTPAAGYTIIDDQAALYVHALFAARDQGLGIIEANFVSMPARLLALLRCEGERIATDVELGTLDRAIAQRLPPDTAAQLESHLGGANPRRAAEIRSALREGSPGLARRLWPSLRLILANATGPFAHYAERLRAGDGHGVPILSTVYAASEGLLGVALNPTEDGGAAYCLVPRSAFFEFVPRDTPRNARDEAPSRMRAEAARRWVREAPQRAAVGAQSKSGTAVDEQPRTLLSHELEAGREYELIITNLGGLYRYRLGDVVRIAGFHRAGAPIVEFRYRLGQVLNVRGEKTSEAALAHAVSAALPAGSVTDFTATELTGDGGSPPRYLVLIEPSDARLMPADASARLDAAMCEVNPVYSTWRAKGAIAPCECRAVRQGGFDALRRRRVEEGASPQQHKTSRVVRSETHLAVLCGRSDD